MDDSCKHNPSHHLIPITDTKVHYTSGYYLLVGFSVAFVQGLSLIQANVAGRTKKTVFTSSVFVSYCVGNLIGPQVFLEHEAPRYRTGFAVILACFGFQAVLLIGMYFQNLLENRKVSN